MKLKILLSNDDGVYAEGLSVLAESLRPFADITVVAPDRNRSGASTSLTLNNPLHVKSIGENISSVEGTPTDCVHLAVTGLLEEPADMVITGINEGANLGDDVWYSGTVAAAVEGRYLGLPAIAVSLAGGEEMKHYETAGRVVVKLVQQLLQDPLPAGTILNVNVPDCPYEDLAGFEITRLGTRHCAEPMIREVNPRGKTIYWVGPPGTEADSGPGTDFHAIHRRKVSITPLQIDLTHYQAFDQLSGWLSGFEGADE